MADNLTQRLITARVTFSKPNRLAVKMVAKSPRGPKGDKGDPGETVQGPPGPPGPVQTIVNIDGGFF